MTVNDRPIDALRRRAREAARHLVLPEGTEPRTIEAACRVAALGIARITLLGDPARIRAEARDRAFDLGGVDIRGPAGPGRETDDLVRAYRERQGARGLTELEARDHLKRPLLVAALEVSARRYDGLVAGAESHALRTVFHGIGTAAEVKRASSFKLLATPRDGGREGSLLVFADGGVQIDPSAAELAEIALLTARSARSFLTEPPRVALLSFSTRGSASHRRTRKVAEAMQIVQARAPRLIADGELQVDAALVPQVAAMKAPGSPVGGNANVLIFPDRESADIAGGVLEGLCRAFVLGPILQGLARPANLVAQDCTVDDIVDLVAVTAVQATAEP